MKTYKTRNFFVILIAIYKKTAHPLYWVHVGILFNQTTIVNEHLSGI